MNSNYKDGFLKMIDAITDIGIPMDDELANSLKSVAHGVSDGSIQPSESYENWLMVVTSTIAAIQRYVLPILSERGFTDEDAHSITHCLVYAIGLDAWSRCQPRKRVLHQVSIDDGDLDWLSNISHGLDNKGANVV